jgi:predicted Fe-Mo cluster-binding NifX family protein
MKVAIASNGNTLESGLDTTFARCNFFVVYDPETRAMEFIPNPNKDLEEGVGPASVHLLESRSVKKIVAREFGLKIKPLLDSLKIQMIVLKESKKTIKEIMVMLNH